MDNLYKDNIVEAVIAYISSEHKKKTKENLCQTALYKYLAFFDFKSLDDIGETSTGLTYIAMERGPVPKEIYIEKKYRKSHFYRFNGTSYVDKSGEKRTRYDIIPVPGKKKTYLDYLSEYNIKMLNDLIFMFAQSWITANIMSDASHKEIKAWRRTWEKDPNTEINFEDAFDDLEKKCQNNTATTPEEHFFIHKILIA